MTGTTTVQLPPISVVVDNPNEWATITQEMASRAGAPPAVGLDLLTGVVASAAPLLFEADATRSPGLLRGTFTDPVIAQVQRNLGYLNGERPESAVVHLIGSPTGAGPAVIRIHVQVGVRSPEGASGVSRQFWDLTVGAQVVVAQATCPNCGAPLAPGQLICDHCRADVRSVVQVPLAVSRLELY
jgi:hypothetical protein